MGYELARWDPISELVCDFWGRGRSLCGDGVLWAPAMDVEETHDEVIVKVELPGLAREAIKVQAHGDTLVITGERRRETAPQDKTVHVVERSYGKFQRVLGLPAGVDGARATATYEQGVLTVRLPKSEQAKPKEITVEVR